MDVTKFDKRKYGRELLIDTGLISANDNFIVNYNQFIEDFIKLNISCNKW